MEKQMLDDNLQSMEQEKLSLEKKLAEIRQKINNKKIDAAGDVMAISLPDMLSFFSKYVDKSYFRISNWEDRLPMWGEIHGYMKDKLPGLEEKLNEEKYKKRPDFMTNAMSRVNKTQLFNQYADRPEQQKKVKQIWSLATTFCDALNEMEHYLDGNSAERCVEFAQRLSKNSSSFKNPEDKKLLLQTINNYMQSFKPTYRWGMVDEEIETNRKKIEKLDKKDTEKIVNRVRNKHEML